MLIDRISIVPVVSSDCRRSIDRFAIDLYDDKIALSICTLQYVHICLGCDSILAQRYS